MPNVIGGPMCGLVMHSGTVCTTSRQAAQMATVETDIARPRSLAGKISEQTTQGSGPIARLKAAV